MCTLIFSPFFLQPQHSVPDVFIWLISGNKRLAYQRINARHLLYSMIEEEKGKNCGVLQTLFLKVGHTHQCLTPSPLGFFSAVVTHMYFFSFSTTIFDCTVSQFTIYQQLKTLPLIFWFVVFCFERSNRHEFQEPCSLLGHACWAIGVTLAQLL